jgi:hypothetical protein
VPAAPSSQENEVSEKTCLLCETLAREGSYNELVDRRENVVHKNPQICINNLRIKVMELSDALRKAETLCNCGNDPSSFEISNNECARCGRALVMFEEMK